MYSFLLRKLNIRRAEASIAFLMFVAAGFLGIFLSTFDIAAHAIFLDQLEQRDLALAYIFSGVLGICIFFVYARAFRRLKTKVFNFINSLVIFSISAAYFYFFLVYPGIWSAFFGLVVMFPVNLLAFLNFWRYFRRLFNPKQTRRLFPFVEFGFILGIIGGSYSVLLILREYDYYIIPLLTLFSIAVIFVLQLIINPVHRYTPSLNHRKENYIPVKRPLTLIFASRFSFSLFLFALFSSIIGSLIHFGFINLSFESFPDVSGVSKFYGLFTGTMYLMIFLVSKFLIRKILYTYDSPYSLVLMPVFVLLMLIATFVVGLLFRQMSPIDRITFLFLLVGMNKMVFAGTHYLIQVPAMRTLYKTLDIRILQVIVPRIEGTGIMLGMLFSGGIILGILNFRFSPIYGVLLAAAILTPIWFLLAVRLIKLYKKALQDSFKKLRIAARVSYNLHENYDEKIRKILVGDDPVKVINAMHLSSRIEPLEYEKSLQRMLANPQPEIQLYVLQCIEHEAMIDLLPELKTLQPASGKNGELLAKIIYNFEDKMQAMNMGLDLETMVTSRRVKDRVFAAEVIGLRRDITYTSTLVNLTREFEPDVKIAAVKAMARMSNPEHSYLLIEFLNSPEYHAYAFEALVRIGDPAIEYLERFFLNANTDDLILARVLRIYGKISSAKSVDLLLTKLDNQSRTVTNAAIAALHSANFQASSLNVHRILNIVVRTISILGWNYLVYTSLSGKEKYHTLRTAFWQEIEMNYDLLFNLLSLAYNARTLREIRDLIDNGDSADLSHAIEMLDHFVFDDIKPVLFPIIENIKPEERVRRLQYYFPIESMNEEEIISFTLTRDYNLLSIYPRVCAMQLALEIKDYAIPQELTANLFHPNQLLREVAAMVIHTKDKALFGEVFMRLEPEIQHQLADTLSALEHGDRLLIVEKFNMLKQTDKLYNLPESILIELAESFEERNFYTAQEIDLEKSGTDFALFVAKRSDILCDQLNTEKISTDTYQLYYARILKNAGIKTITFKENATILAIDNETIETFLFDHSEIATCVLSVVEQFKLAG
jgi:hypothetical protein